jgi:hypothetical protein
MTDASVSPTPHLSPLPGKDSNIKEEMTGIITDLLKETGVLVEQPLDETAKLTSSANEEENHESSHESIGAEPEVKKREKKGMRKKLLNVLFDKISRIKNF